MSKRNPQTIPGSTNAVRLVTAVGYISGKYLICRKDMF